MPRGPTLLQRGVQNRIFFTVSVFSNLFKELSKIVLAYIACVILICVIIISCIFSSYGSSPKNDTNVIFGQNETVSQWLKSNGHGAFEKHVESGIGETGLAVVDLHLIDKVPEIPSEVKKSLKGAAQRARDKLVMFLWLQERFKIEASVLKSLDDLGIDSLEELSQLSEDVTYSLTSEDLTLASYSTLKSAVYKAKSTKVKLEDLMLFQKVQEGQKFSWKSFFKVVVTLSIGVVLLQCTPLMDCLREIVSGRPVSEMVNGRPVLRWASRSQRQLARSAVDNSATANSDKNWLWKLFWGPSIFAPSCVVKWGWEDSQVVGSTMSFTVKLFRKNGKPYVTTDTNAIYVEILHKGIKVACTKQLDQEDPDSNTVRVAFTVHRAGNYKISIMVSGRHVKDSPFTKSFEPGPIDAGRTGFTNYCSTIVCTTGLPYPLTIETQDSFGNPAVYKADQNNYFKIKVVETESNKKYVPATQLIYNPEHKQLTMHIKMEREGCYQAAVSYGDVKLRNGEFNILVINADDMSHVNRNLSKKRHNIWYEARLLPKNPDSTEKAKRVYVYISPKQLILKEFYLKILGKRLFTWRVCPSTKFYFNGYNSKYEAPVMTIYDCSQPPVVLAAKDRSIIAATFTNFLLRNIGGSETFQDKQSYFSQEVRKLQKSGTTTIKINRSNLLYSSYRATKGFDSSDWYRNIQVVFVGEQGLDWGGVRREWFEVICTELFDPSKSPFFVRLTEDSQGLVHPNPKRDTESKLKYYEFAGKVVGKCLYDSARGSAYRQLVKAKFTRSFLAQLIGLQVNYKYFETDDPDLYKTKVTYISENNINDMDLTFSEDEYSSDGHLLRVVDLIPNGSRIPVTNENKQHYLNALAQYKLASSVKDEVESFLKGLNSIIPDNLLSIFDENELELLMCGTGNYSIVDFKAHAVIDGSSFSFQKVLDWFWTVVASFTEEQMARLLQFTTGCSQLPPAGFADLNPKFQISFSPTYNSLPTAHTCFNQLCLPDYETIEHLHQSLLIAINEGSQGFGLV